MEPFKADENARMVVLKMVKNGNNSLFGIRKRASYTSHFSFSMKQEHIL